MQGSINVITSLPLDGRKMNEEGEVRVTIFDDQLNPVATARMPLADWTLVTMGHRANHPVDITIYPQENP